MKGGNEGIKLSPMKSETMQKMIENGDQVLCGQLCSIELKVQDYEMPKEVEKFLEKFADVFEKPKGLPPNRDHEHHMHLVNGEQPLKLRPYRYAHC